MGVAELILDNPILIKHIRSRFRPGHALPWFVIVFVLCVCTAWAGHAYDDHYSAILVLLGLQVLALTLGGAHQITASLGGARETGLLDFHRVSPLPPAVVALGFFLGAPIREYALAALTVPFAAFCACFVDLFSLEKGVLWYAQLEAAVLVTTLLVHASFMLGCLTRKKPRGSILGTLIAIGVLLYFGTVGSVGFYFGARWLLENPLSMNLFGAMVPWLPWLILYEACAIGFVGLAVTRKMGAERAHAFTKPQALACMGTLSVLAIAGLWKIGRVLPVVPPYRPTMVDFIILATIYGVSFAAMILAKLITPDVGEYIKGMRRATHEGRRRPSSWSDAGSNRLVLFLLCALVLITTTAVVSVAGKQRFEDPARLGNWWASQPEAIDLMNLSEDAWRASRQEMFSRPIAASVLTVAYFGLASQFFMFRSRRFGLVMLGLFLFAVWLVPILVGAIVAMGNTPTAESRALAIISLSPLPGVALCSGLDTVPGADTIRLAAVAPPITFAFIFNYLLVIIQRKLDRQLRDQAKAPGPEFATVRPELV